MLFQELQPKKNSANAIPQFLGMMFAFRDKLHLLHLLTTSYAQHKALDEAYSGLLDLADGLIEGVQGVYGLQNITIGKCEEYSTAIENVQYMYKYVDANRSIFKETWIQNVLDEIQHLLAQTLYKLKFLK